MKASSDRIYCQNSLIIYHLMCLFEINYPKDCIKDSVKAFESYPKMSVRNLVDVLKVLGIDGVAIKTKPETLKRLETPFIGYVANGEINKYFVIIKWIRENQVCYYSADEGDVIEDFNNFLEIWTGIIVLVGVENYKVLTTDIIDSERELANKYKQSCVQLMPNFLSDVECQQIIDYTEKLGEYSNSKIIGIAGEAVVDDTRTSYSINLPPDALPLFAEIRNRVTSFLGVPESYIEGLQCVRYSEGQQFAPHLDTNERLNRKHTLLVYLNDDFIGGETYFPELLLKVLPVKGNALYFQNQDEDGHAIPFSIHAGLRLKKGIKYACNIWVKDRNAI